MSFSGGGGDGGWEEYFRRQFPEVTIEKLDAFAKEYRGSDEERGHIINAYRSSRGWFCIL